MPSLATQLRISALTTQQILRVERMFDQGFGATHIAKKLNVSVRTINNVRTKLKAYREDEARWRKENGYDD